MTGRVNAAPVAEDIYTVANPEDKKAFVPIVRTEFGIVIDVKLEQLWNAATPIVVTEFGIVIDVKLLQFWNTDIPILVTKLPIVIDVKLLQFWNTA